MEVDKTDEPFEDWSQEKRDEVAQRALSRGVVQFGDGRIEQFSTWDGALDACVDGRGDVAILGILDFDDAGRAELREKRLRLEG